MKLCVYISFFLTHAGGGGGGGKAVCSRTPQVGKVGRVLDRLTFPRRLLLVPRPPRRTSRWRRGGGGGVKVSAGGPRPTARPIRRTENAHGANGGREPRRRARIDRPERARNCEPKSACTNIKTASVARDSRSEGRDDPPCGPPLPPHAHAHARLQ